MATAITVVVHLSDQARRARLVASGELADAWPHTTLDMAQFTPEDRERLIAMLGIPDPGKVWEPFKYLPLSEFRASILPVTREEWLLVLDEVAAFRAGLAEQAKREKEAEDARRAESDAHLVAFLDEVEPLEDAPFLAAMRLKGSLYHYSSNLGARVQAAFARRDALARAEREAEESAKAAELAAVEAVKAAWIAEHGSDHLLKAYGAGYDCQRLYVEERAALEVGPDWAVDWHDLLDWVSRSCPSEAALALALEHEEHGAEVVWVKRWPDEEQERGEGVLIQNYLDKYTLFQVFGS